VDEIGTRLVPWQQLEVSHARNRPLAERPPLPHPGDRVWYRRFEWNRDPGTGDLVEPESAVIVEVQDPRDTSDADYVDGVGWVRDPNLWHLVRDVNGVPIVDPGGLRYAPVADPWPWVRLRRPNGIVDCTREARLRGSAGWLPLDYLTRPERWRLPSETALVSTRPVLRPLNVPLPAPAPGRG
jgi:hypothetical protein